jgi:hypothetical protein
VGREGTAEDVIIGTALVDIEASAPVQLSKPMLTKAFKAAVQALDRVRIGKHLMEAHLRRLALR